MKKLMMILGLIIGITFGANAEGGTVNKQLVQKRADRLTDMMIQDLKLNYYQARKLRAINMEKTAMLMAYENQLAGDQSAMDAKCKGVCNERDAELEDLLSTDQYSKYFGARKKYNTFDRQFTAETLVNNKKKETEDQEVVIN